MDVYGLTGGIGSGKSAVASLLEEYGIPVVSADELSRMVVAKGTSSLQAVVDAFGDEVLSEDKELDRKAMAKIVFADADKRRELESILHPKIRERFEQVLEALENAGHAVIVYEVPLLFEKKLQADMHAVILVTADTELRIARVMARDEASREQVEARMKTQMPEDEKRLLANYLVLNDGDMDDLRRDVQIIISRFLKIDPSGKVNMVDPEGDKATPTRPSSTGTGAEADDELEPEDGDASEPLPPSRVDTIISVPAAERSRSTTLAGTPRVPPPPSSSSTSSAPPPPSSSSTSSAPPPPSSSSTSSAPPPTLGPAADAAAPAPALVPPPPKVGG